MEKIIYLCLYIVISRCLVEDEILACHRIKGFPCSLVYTQNTLHLSVFPTLTCP
jgi:hypothetical protein